VRQERLDHLPLSVGERCSLGAEHRGTRPGAFLDCCLCAESAFGQLDLVRESYLLGNAGLRPALWVIRPLLGQIQRPVDEG
jgi:hypothetical protein